MTMRSFYLILSVSLLCACSKEQTAVYHSTSEEAFIANNSGLSDQERLGKLLFFDQQLSNPVGNSCASCHSPSSAFSDPAHNAFSKGALGLEGSRNAPTVSYLAYTPDMYYKPDDGTWIGGFFYDGRQHTLAGQASEPLLNSREMNNGNIGAVVSKVKAAGYANLYVSVYGNFSDDSTDFRNITKSIEVFERSGQVSPFTSKYDLFIAGKTELSEQEMRGLNVFVNSKKGNCAACHSIDPDPLYGKVLFTDFSYDNIGLPVNPAQQTGIPDLGLGITKNDPNENGKFKVPTLRNIANTAPYFHNGLFKTLEEAVEFYNRRDIDPALNQPEVSANVNRDELGDLRLSDAEVQDLVAFLKTLSDGYSLK